MVDADALWRVTFDGLTALLLLYLAFYIPFAVAFLHNQHFDWFDLFQLVWFSVDMCLSFVTPYETDQGVLVPYYYWCARFGGNVARGECYDPALEFTANAGAILGTNHCTDIVQLGLAEVTESAVFKAAK